MNPYEVLGLEPTATPHQIKVAYRRAAKRTHPDSGGDPVAFAEVSRAHAILIDPDLRKRFDETGSIDEIPPMSVRSRMIVIIAGMFNEALNAETQRGASFDHFDLMAAMRGNMTRNLDAVRQNRDAARKRLADRKILLKRIVRKDDEENLFADMIRQQMAQLEPVLRQAEIDVLAMEMAVDELTHYKSEVELVQAVPYMQFAGNLYGSNNTAGNSVFGFNTR
jgi:curved DNA-binding protein CbpA